MRSAKARPLVQIELHGAIAHIQLVRPEKRNALSISMIRRLDELFGSLPGSVAAVVLEGKGEHFCAGLDLSEIQESTPAAGIARSQSWYAAFAKIQFGSVPVVTVMQGAVVGGGLELACSTHIRVAEETAYYALPEGQRGIFVGGGGSVRIPKIIGFSRMTDLMLTGRVYGALEGQQLGLSHYVTPPGEGLKKAHELAERIASNAPLSNFAIMHALPRIAEQPMEHGLFTEALMAALSADDTQAKKRVKAFLDKKAGKVGR
jgi:enoyl-CoA hydratase/carnithine racemase